MSRSKAKGVFRYRDVRITPTAVSAGEMTHPMGEILGARYDVSVTSNRRSRWVAVGLHASLTVFLLFPAVILCCTGHIGIGFVLLSLGGFGMWKIDQRETRRELHRISRFTIYVSQATGEVMLTSWFFSGSYLQKGKEKMRCRQIVALIEEHLARLQA